jgi:protein-disulfide isomerase
MPLDIHKDAPLAHVAAMAAGDQGRFWEFHDKLFANQTKIKREFLLQYARELGLDMKKFEHALDIEQARPVIDADEAEAKALGITGTPAFFVNGRFLSGAKPFEEFAQVINAELTRLKLPVPPMPAKTPGKAGG